MGRPSSYKPEYCKMLIEHMKTGMSYESFSKIAKCTISTLYNWEELFPEFSEAKKEAMQENLYFWEDIGIKGLHDEKEYDERGKLSYSKSLNPTLFIFNMKNRFPDKWRDRKELDQKIDQKSTVSIDNADLILMNDLLKELIKSKNG